MTATLNPARPRVRVPRSYDDEFLACRDYGHAWEDDLETQPQRSALRAARTIHRASVGRASTCARCGTIRIDWIGPDGGIVSRTYQYAENYHYVSPSGKLTKGVVRIARLRRAGLIR